MIETCHHCGTADYDDEVNACPNCGKALRPEEDTGYEGMLDE